MGVREVLVRRERLRPLTAPKEPGNIAGSVDHSHDLDSAIRRVVEDHVASTREHPQSGAKILTRLPEERLLAEKCKPLVKTVELSIRRVRVISRDVVPNLTQIGLGLVRQPNGFIDRLPSRRVFDVPPP